MKIPSTALRRTGVLLLGVSLLAGCAGMCSRGESLPPPPPPPPPPPGGPFGHHPPRDPAFAQAMQACLQELGVEKPAAEGPGKRGPARPDREAIDACLEEKGVQPPHMPPPPPRDPALEAAFEACRATLGLEHEPGPPPPEARERLHACLKEKGVAPPSPGEAPPPRE
ncbi:hypothetical protein ARC20_11955 [Stenotrophomonas panacihumi]|uniref:Uncharacterized protein n=1 Tax=Stenotrophomonas panacihumi TaxID=676599 RepID=A0A0R0AK91_9GAMM|nr:hypothetical protein [Stenotrophomonas panacihumi]KRG40947.1 hypothetical protein ARC20_11955 [Stenotrophomonas panacihumi]PTN53565.1 hypothetical protein C9J98_14785 [Stenotrophomonas panacihumi]